MTSSTEQHHVEADGYCNTCATVGCLQRSRPQPRRNTGLVDEIRALREDIAAIADHLGVARPRNCQACGVTYRGDACPMCGTRADVARQPPAEPPAGEPS